MIVLEINVLHTNFFQNYCLVMLVSRVLKQHWNQWPLTDSIFLLYRNHKDIHDYLVSQDTSTTSGFTDLHWAAVTGQSQVIQSLLTEGSDINAEVGIRNVLAY